VTTLRSAAGGGKSPYAAGRAFERSVRGQLERRDWFVMRAYASKGIIDLLAVGKDRPALMIQAKRRGVISSSDWNAVYLLALKHGAWPVVAMRVSERTTGFFHLTGERVPRGRGRPWVRFDPATLAELIPPPTLL
jgi:Holliday junction resolvase